MYLASKSKRSFSETQRLVVKLVNLPFLAPRQPGCVVKEAVINSTVILANQEEEGTVMQGKPTLKETKNPSEMTWRMVRFELSVPTANPPTVDPLSLEAGRDVGGDGEARAVTSLARVEPPSRWTLAERPSTSGEVTFASSRRNESGKGPEKERMRSHNPDRHKPGHVQKSESDGCRTWLSNLQRRERIPVEEGEGRMASLPPDI
ncbi:hypothetical protein BKA70DRAFT_1366105, partial [Coprinopsis sp. MPI-PUGE-AT-0042]